MHWLQRGILFSSIIFSISILFNCVFGRHGLLDIFELRKNIQNIEKNIEKLEVISANLTDMQNTSSAEDSFLLEGRKLSFYTAEDVVVQIDQYTKRRLSEDYGSISMLYQGRAQGVFKVAYSISGVMAFFFFLVFIILGGVEKNGSKTPVYRQHRPSHSFYH